MRRDALTLSGAQRRLGLALSNESPVSETVALARRAEDLGLSEVWLPESGHGRGVFTVAAAVAAATQRIKIGIGVVNPFWRHPSLIAMEAAALDELSHGRVMLGLGAALWTLRALGEADQRTERPLTAMVEAIGIVRRMLRSPAEAGDPTPPPVQTPGAQVADPTPPPVGMPSAQAADPSPPPTEMPSAQGADPSPPPVQMPTAQRPDPHTLRAEIFVTRSDAHLDFPLARLSVPVYVGAVNARMLQASGACADGVQLGAIVSPGYAHWAWQQIARGATEAGRDPTQIDLVSNVLLSVGTDPRAARDAVRNVLAYYIHRVDPVVLSTSGADPHQLQLVRQAVLDNGVNAGARLVSEDMIDVFAAAGDPDHVAGRLHAYLAAGLRGILAWHVLGPNRQRALQLLAEVVRPIVFTDTD